ncbi:MAG TPA: GFA family protein [Arsenicitalea sp.]|jgi:hypothetical protein|nr:GFA family protein [Arsenicitalea sp.]
MATIRTGGCSCGRLRYRLEGEPFLTGICHCTNCRKESGSVFTAYAKWPIEAFALQGEFSTFEGRSFCPNCGSRLFNIHETDVEIRIGSLDEAPTTVIPMQEGWIKRREHWLVPIAGATQSREDPER